MGTMVKSLLLQLLLYQVGFQISSSHHIITKCRKSNSNAEQVIWNVTIFGLTNDSLKNIFVQNKEHQRYPEEWRDLTECNRRFSINESSIQCAITEQNWFMYALRVVERKYFAKNTSYNEEPGSITHVNTTTLFEEHGHYQSGLLCYPSHDVVNLTSSALTADSFNVSWSFYPWDVELIEFLHVRVMKEQVLHNGSHNFLPISDFPYLEPELWTSITVRGLESCTKYKVNVMYQYISYHDEVKRTKSINVQTKCPHSTPSNRRLIVAFTLLAYMVIAGAGISAFCVIYRRKSGARARSLSNSDIIDDCVITAELCVLRMKRPSR